MKNTVIHVGLHKTATTFLQYSVFPQATEYLYLTRPYTQLNHAFNRLQYADPTMFNLEDLRSEVEALNVESILLSDESFSGKPTYFSYINRTLIAERLSKIFPNAKILLVLRDQIDIMVSHYSSYIKMPYGTKQIEDLFWKPGADFSFKDGKKPKHEWEHDGIYYNTNELHIHMDCFQYHSLVQMYRSLFGSCEVLLYEDLRHSPNAFAKNIGNLLGINVEMERLKRENKSLSASELAKKRFSNRAASPFNSKYVRKGLDIALKAAPPVPTRDLRSVISTHVGNYYAEDNAKLKLALPNLSWNKYPDRYISATPESRLA